MIEEELVVTLRTLVTDVHVQSNVRREPLGKALSFLWREGQSALRHSWAPLFL